MKKWFNDHPYLMTSAIFMAIVVFGWQLLYWRWENFAFLLLLYFIVTLGIRLDEISKRIGSGTNPISPGSDEKESISSQLNDIKMTLRSINATLKRNEKEKEIENLTRNYPD
jgi:hypothetical protein